MKKITIKLLSICSVLFLASCSPKKLETAITNITVEASEGFFEAMKEFQEKMQKVTAAIESDERFSNVSVIIESDFSSTDNENLSTFVLLLHYDKAHDTDDETLQFIAEETLQKTISNLEDPSYDGYEIRFLKDASTDEEDPEIYKSYEFTVEKLMEV